VELWQLFKRFMIAFVRFSDDFLLYIHIIQSLTYSSGYCPLII
jgi:hypothetical protein